MKKLNFTVGRLAYESTRLLIVAILLTATLTFPKYIFQYSRRTNPFSFSLALPYAVHFKKIEKLYPKKTLYGPLQKQGNSISYKKELERERKDTCINLLKKYTSVQKIFSCDIFESDIN